MTQKEATLEKMETMLETINRNREEMHKLHMEMEKQLGQWRELYFHEFEFNTTLCAQIKTLNDIIHKYRPLP